MTTTIRKPITSRSAWRPSDFPSRDAYSIALTDAHLAALDAALGTARAGGRTLELATLHDFALDAIAADLAGWRAEVLHGRGFVVLRGIVYCTSGDSPGEVVAFDGRTGAVAWSADVGTYDQVARLMTDGRVLLVGLTPQDGAREGALVAMSLADGQRLWRVPLPDGLDVAWTQGHVLVAGSTGDPAPAVVLGSP